MMMRSMMLLAVLCPVISQAAIEIQIYDTDGGMTTVLSNGDKARMNSANEAGYTLVDYKKQAMYIVMPEEKQIMDITSDMPASSQSKASKLKINLVEQGNGPNIAGYATKKYSLSADGKNCGYVFGSKDAMSATGIEKLFSSMQRFAEKQQAMMGAYTGMMDSCDRAEMDFARQGKTTGIPMRTVDKNGRTTSEVKRINTSASVPDSSFELPQGYQVVTMAEQMQRAQREMQQHAPQMEQMMKQMQGSGGQMPPEMMEQMKRMQEMMQQYQQ